MQQILFCLFVCGFLYMFCCFSFFRGAGQGTESRASHMLSKCSSRAVSQTQAQRNQRAFLDLVPP